MRNTQRDTHLTQRTIYLSMIYDACECECELLPYVGIPRNSDIVDDFAVERGGDDDYWW